MSTQAFCQADRVWTHVHLASFAAGNGAPYGARRDYAVAVRDGVISALAPVAALQGLALRGELIDGGGRWMTPGLIDCHSHLVFAGSRAQEFEQRLQGVPYAEIARAGGGILATVAATRAASEDELFALAVPRVRAMIAAGVTTLEVKSGYGLTLADELKMLRVARRLGYSFPLRVRTTLLAAHTLPPEFSGRAERYIELICQEMIPAAAADGLADAVDVFCEGIGFSPAQCERVFLAARAHGLAIKAHAEQLSDLKGALLAARHGALSVDHLEYLAAEDVAQLAAAGTVAVLLPGAFYFLRESQLPPIAALREAKVPLALATDFNPGSSPFLDLRLMMNMACTLFRLTPEEALAGVTRHAARALGLQDHIGRIETGMAADLLLWDVEHPAELACQVGVPLLQQRIYHGAPTDV